MKLRTSWTACVALCAAAWAVPGPVLAQDAGMKLEEHTAESAAKLIADAKGKPVLAVIYASSCVRSRGAFPKLIELGHRHAARAQVLAFGVDRTEAPLRKFLEGHPLSFAPRWIKPWQKGELVKAFKPLGFKIGSSLEMPIIAVLDREGRMVRQWSPALDLAEVEAQLKAVE